MRVHDDSDTIQVIDLGMVGHIVYAAPLNVRFNREGNRTVLLPSSLLGLPCLCQLRVAFQAMHVPDKAEQQLAAARQDLPDLSRVRHLLLHSCYEPGMSSHLCLECGTQSCMLLTPHCMAIFLVLESSTRHQQLSMHA